MIPPTLWAGPPLLPLRWGDAAVGVGRNQKHHRRPPNRSQIGPLLKNGTLDAATTPATAANTPRATTAPVLIGGDSSTHRFSGTLDDVSIYGRALSDREIADLANIVDKRYQYHHLNALGSNIVLTNDNQKVLARYEYDIFGAIRAETGTSDNTRKFTGKERGPAPASLMRNRQSLIYSWYIGNFIHGFVFHVSHISLAFHYEKKWLTYVIVFVIISLDHTKSNNTK